MILGISNWKKKKLSNFLTLNTWGTYWKTPENMGWVGGLSTALVLWLLGKLPSKGTHYPISSRENIAKLLVNWMEQGVTLLQERAECYHQIFQDHLMWNVWWEFIFGKHTDGSAIVTFCCYFLLFLTCLFIWLCQACRIFWCGTWTLRGREAPEHTGFSSCGVVAYQLSCSEVCGISVPWPGMEPMVWSPALQGRFFTTGLPGKFLPSSLLEQPQILCW